MEVHFMKKVTFSMIIVVVVALFLFYGCGSDNSPVTGPDVENGQLAKALPDVALEHIMAVQDKITPDLMDIPGVVGTASGYGVDGKGVIMVFVRDAGVSGVPRFIDGVPVMTKVTGEIKALGKPSSPPGLDKEKVDTEFDRTARADRPVPIGISTGHPAVTAGTIGARVTDGIDVYALSNNHVYANENLASTGDIVLQPGAYDGGAYPGDDIGTLADFEPINFNGLNEFDAAIALCSPFTLGKATPPDGYGTPKSQTVPARINLKVKKYGRTTGLTTGKIYAVNATVNVGYDSGTALFTGQIIVIPGSFSAGGDSGSLVVSNDKSSNNSPVGLLFAGSSTMTIVNPIDPILQRFGVTIDGE